MKRLLISIAIALFGFMPVSLAMVPAYADSKDQVCQGLGVAEANCNGDASGTSGINKTLKAVVNILSLAVGIAAVIMIIIAGLKYVTSGGDSNNISSAKTTLIYALVGVVVAVLAQVLVQFVLGSVKP